MNSKQIANLFYESLAWQDVAATIADRFAAPSVAVRELRIQADKLRRMITEPFGNFKPLRDLLGINVPTKKMNKRRGEYSKRLVRQHKKVLALVERVIQDSIDAPTRAQKQEVMGRMENFVALRANFYRKEISR